MAQPDRLSAAHGNRVPLRVPAEDGGEGERERREKACLMRRGSSSSCHRTPRFCCCFSLSGKPAAAAAAKHTHTARTHAVERRRRRLAKAIGKGALVSCPPPPSGNAPRCTFARAATAAVELTHARTRALGPRRFARPPRSNGSSAAAAAAIAVRYVEQHPFLCHSGRSRAPGGCYPSEPPRLGEAIRSAVSRARCEIAAGCGTRGTRPCCRGCSRTFGDTMAPISARCTSAPTIHPSRYAHRPRDDVDRPVSTGELLHRGCN